MQFRATPTRYEVNKAHSKRKQLIVGVQSVRNLLDISKKRSSVAPDARSSIQSYVRQIGRDIDRVAHTTLIRHGSAIFAQISATDDVFLGTERTFTDSICSQSTSSRPVDNTPILSDQPGDRT
jgi:hypothetical protein